MEARDHSTINTPLQQKKYYQIYKGNQGASRVSTVLLATITQDASGGYQHNPLPVI